jgi:hypothetical protein
VKIYTVRFYSPFDSRGNLDGYVTIEYPSRQARLQGWGIDYPGRGSELEFSSIFFDKITKVPG